MTEVFTAKSVEEAKEMAAKKFGKSISEIRFEVIEEGSKGFLGIGAKEAKVKATYIAEAPKPVATAPSVTAPAPAVKKEEAPAAEPVKEEAKAEPAPAPVKEAAKDLGP